MSLYSDYIYETRFMSVVHDPHGFASYLISGDECYVEDVFVNKDYRRTKVATNMINEIKRIAECQNCKYLTTTVNGKINDPDSSLKACFAYGFKIHRIINDIILLRMEIKNESRG